VTGEIIPRQTEAVQNCSTSRMFWDIPGM